MRRIIYRTIYWLIGRLCPPEDKTTSQIIKTNQMKKPIELSPITTKKIQMLNHRHELIKESTVFLSSRLAQFNQMINDFKLSEDNPIRLSSNKVISDYKTLTESIGKLGKALEKTTDEILVDRDN
jgi:hypothetical protein